MITTDVLSADERAGVTALLETVTDHDAVAPLDEAARLALRGPGARHHLVAHPDGSGTVIGYASVLADGTTQGMVHPDHRRHGRGSELLRAVLAERPDAGVWAHGALEPALALLTGHGLRETRRLLTLRRPLDAAHPVPAVPAPDLPGLVLSAFEGGADLEDWVDLNARAFAEHPEQGSLTRQDVEQRMAEPWFTPEDLLLARLDGDLVGFVWVKRDQTSQVAGDGTASGADGPAEDAELYVVATAPQMQGRGLGRLLIGTTLERLRDAGVTEVELYVEADNAPALALYERWGFTVVAQDVQFRTAEEV